MVILKILARMIIRVINGIVNVILEFTEGVVTLLEMISDCFDGLDDKLDKLFEKKEVKKEPINIPSDGKTEGDLA